MSLREKALLVASPVLAVVGIALIVAGGEQGTVTWWTVSGAAFIALGIIALVAFLTRRAKG